MTFEEFIDHLRIATNDGPRPLTTSEREFATFVHNAWKEGKLVTYGYGYLRSGEKYISGKIREYMEQKQQET